MENGPPPREYDEWSQERRADFIARTETKEKLHQMIQSKICVSHPIGEDPGWFTQAEMAAIFVELSNGGGK